MLNCFLLIQVAASEYIKEATIIMGYARLTLSNLRPVQPASFQEIKHTTSCLTRDAFICLCALRLKEARVMSIFHPASYSLLVE